MCKSAMNVLGFCSNTALHPPALSVPQVTKGQHIWRRCSRCWKCTAASKALLERKWRLHFSTTSHPFRTGREEEIPSNRSWAGLWNLGLDIWKTTWESRLGKAGGIASLILPVWQTAPAISAHSLHILPTSGVQQTCRDTTPRWQKEGTYEEELGEQDIMKRGKDQKAGERCSGARSDTLESTKYSEALQEAARTREQTWQPEPWVQVCGELPSSAALARSHQTRQTQSLNTGTEQFYHLKGSFKHHQLSRLERSSCLQSGAFQLPWGWAVMSPKHWSDSKTEKDRKLLGLGVPTAAWAEPFLLPAARKSCPGKSNLPCKVPNPSHANSNLPPSTDTSTGTLTSSDAWRKWEKKEGPCCLHTYTPHLRP